MAPLLPQVAERMRVVLDSGRYILGPEVEAFEQEFAAVIGARYCIAVANGTDALTIALRALGVGPGCEVVVPAVTFYATAEAVVNAGARPVFSDVDPDTWCMTETTVEEVMTERTAALLPVHLFGNPAPVEQLRRLLEDRPGRPVLILEDAAQAAGATLGGRMAGVLGDAAAFSFYPSKNLGGFGDGGAITTDNKSVADACQRLRAHGSNHKGLHETVGYNSRLDELQAAGLRVLLPELERWTRSRRELATAYRDIGLGEFVRLPAETDGAKSSYHLYVVTTPVRDALGRALSARGVGNRIYYSPPLHKQPGMASYAGHRDLPGAMRFAEECLALPMGPGLRTEEAASVAEAVSDSLRDINAAAF